MSEVLDRETLKALSTDTRQEIIKMLSKRPYTASELSKLMSKHVTTITEHLNTLEKSGLIRRKDNSNKWVYYALSDKGERLFKPKFYSWVVVLVVSVLCLFIGGAQMFSFGASSFSMREALKAAETAPSTQTLLGETTVAYPPYTAAVILILIAIIGFAYLIWRYKRNRNAIGTIDMIKL